ncbi:MAG: hypothetical protein QOD58_596 [Mycobacterium sp.]|jgi:pimeloyl-ACP methyl ester carboxylesterase|nr:hypothetical protein [Mycobacterium sp.]
MFVRIRTARVVTPLLVLDGEQDANLTREEVHATASAYRAQATFIPNMGHDMMLEPGWRVVAESIESFLKAKGL